MSPTAPPLERLECLRTSEPPEQVSFTSRSFNGHKTAAECCPYPVAIDPSDGHHESNRAWPPFKSSPIEEKCGPGADRDPRLSCRVKARWDLGGETVSDPRCWLSPEARELRAGETNVCRVHNEPASAQSFRYF